MTTKTIPTRGEVSRENTWDLSKLFDNDAAWLAGLEEYQGMIAKIPEFRSFLTGGNPDLMRKFLDFYQDLGILEERLGYYSELRQSEDEGDDKAMELSGKFLMAAAKGEAALAWMVPEIQRIDEEAMKKALNDPGLADYRIYLQKILRYKPHVLSENEEKILAIQSEGNNIASQAFTVLTNVDMDFGMVKTPQGDAPLSQSAWSVFMENPDRELRRRVYGQFYGQFDAHKTTLATLYGGAVKKNAIHARIRGYPSAREAALFPDKVDPAVYDNLVETVGNNLAPLHRYYRLRKRLLNLDELRHYDVYAPIVKTASRRTSWEEATDLVCDALAPLGDEYVDVLRAGLLGRWADRYENKGKRSGAFSAGSFTGDPYILMNYKEEALRDIFTIAHEGGHSMHSWHAARNNPFTSYGYTIFEAEVASTLNEELLFRHMRRQAVTPELAAYMVNKRTDDLLSTLYRQTMFAEYEKRTHELEESGVPLTLNVLRSEYRKLLEKYFGPDMVLEEQSDLEGLRIPHFYRAFYVYKYATGVSASLALAARILEGGKQEREDYFEFLKSGGSRYPLESLAIAGVDMSRPEPVERACKIFGDLVEELEKLTLQKE